MALGQLAVTAVSAALFLIWRGGLEAVSALAGGGIAMAAGLAMTVFMFRKSAQGDPKRIVRNAYKGEAAKLAVKVVLFVLVLKFFEVAALPLFLTFVAALAVHWVALVRA